MPYILLGRVYGGRFCVSISREMLVLMEMAGGPYEKPVFQISGNVEGNPPLVSLGQPLPVRIRGPWSRVEQKRIRPKREPLKADADKAMLERLRIELKPGDHAVQNGIFRNRNARTLHFDGVDQGPFHGITRKRGPVIHGSTQSNVQGRARWQPFITHNWRPLRRGIIIHIETESRFPAKLPALRVLAAASRVQMITIADMEHVAFWNQRSFAGNVHKLVLDFTSGIADFRFGRHLVRNDLQVCQLKVRPAARKSSMEGHNPTLIAAAHLIMAAS